MLVTPEVSPVTDCGVLAHARVAVTTVQVVGPVAFPMPSSPLALSPQQNTPLPGESAHVLSMPTPTAVISVGRPDTAIAVVEQTDSCGVPAAHVSGAVVVPSAS